MRAAPAAFVFVLLAGCAAQADTGDEAAESALARTPRAMDWSPGNWWAYQANISGIVVDVALIVHEARADGYRLGSNLSIGFFGLPFHGNLTKELNPRIGPEVWPLYAPPLAEGKEWAYTLFGYDAKSTVRDAAASFELEATSFGQTFARYDFTPEVGWFTRLDLIEPTNGTTVLSARLTAYGPDWGQAYYVEETLIETRLPYPALPGRETIDVPAGYLQVSGELIGTAAVGALTGELRMEDGQHLAQVSVVGRGSQTDRVLLQPRGAMTWTLDHAGAGVGSLYLHLTGLSASGPLSAPTTTDAPRLDLAELLQSTRPDLPQEGHVTSTGPLEGVYGMSALH